MELTVSVCPHEGGYRATAGGTLDLSADGPTADAAVDALRELVIDRAGVGSHARIADLHRLRAHELAIDRVGVASLQTIHGSDVDRALEAAGRVGENPQFDAFLEELAEYRRRHNTVPDAE